LDYYKNKHWINQYPFDTGRRGYDYKQNHLKKLRGFCQTAKLGSMTKAAASLFTSQPTISLQIQALEEEMDTRLFERCGPKLTLEAGGWEVIKR